MQKGFFVRLVKMENNTRKPIRAGKHRVFVDREQDGSFTVVLPGGTVTKFVLAYDAAKYLRDFAHWEDSCEDFFNFRRAARS